jgi:hypothetical protein
MDFDCTHLRKDWESYFAFCAIVDYTQRVVSICYCKIDSKGTPTHPGRENRSISSFKYLDSSSGS